MDPKEKYPFSKEKPGYFYGFNENVGDEMCFKILLPDKKHYIYTEV